MSFVKLDTKILESTLWEDPTQSRVFITALLMAVPHVFETEQYQLEVDRIKKTGFSIPPGWYGFIATAGVGILRNARIDKPRGMKALRELGEPDHESRSAEHDGRRLIRIDGGYVVLNYIKYREHDHSNAERQARYRARRKA